MSVEKGTGKPSAAEEGRKGRWSPGRKSDPAAEVSGIKMDLFILLFKVYLIVTVTRLECMSATGLISCCFCILYFCRSLPDRCVYLFPESSMLNTCASQMRLIKFDE